MQVARVERTREMVSQEIRDARTSSLGDQDCEFEGKEGRTGEEMGDLSGRPTPVLDGPPASVDRHIDAFLHEARVDLADRGELGLVEERGGRGVVDGEAALDLCPTVDELGLLEPARSQTNQLSE